MGRPKLYPNTTARQAAYRARMKATTAWVNRAPFEQTQAALARLHYAISRGRLHGDPWAQTLYRATPEDLLTAVADWFTAYYVAHASGHRAKNESSCHEIAPPPAPRPRQDRKNQEKD